MKQEVKKVRHKGSVVGEVEVPVYESVDELVETESGDKILAMFNKQNAIRIQANERNKHTEARSSKKKLRGVAFNLMEQDEVAKYAGDYAGLQAFLDSDEMQTRVAAAVEADSSE